jgi:DNA-directed RNA polymerase subunit RPC12/RpoP
MASDPAPICIQCGQPTSTSERLNCLQDGRPCPSCSERLMASLRPLLPGWKEAEEVERSLDLPPRDEAGPEPA